MLFVHSFLLQGVVHADVRLRALHFDLSGQARWIIPNYWIDAVSENEQATNDCCEIYIRATQSARIN